MTEFTLPAPARTAEPVVDRILRAPDPALGVVPGTTPVVSYGDPAAASVATLGINPGPGEFLDGHGRLLAGSRRRLATLDSLGVAHYGELTRSHVAAIVADCCSYFDRHERHWFDPLEAIVHAATGASYRNRSACHLHLVQWATATVWIGLSPGVQAELLRTDVPFLRRQLADGHWRVVVVNGRTAMRWAEAGGIVTWHRAYVLDGTTPTGVYTGRCGDVPFVGWGCSLQRQPGAAQHATRLTELLATLTG